jgi:hypothetical protein
LSSPSSLHLLLASKQVATLSSHRSTLHFTLRLTDQQPSTRTKENPAMTFLTSKVCNLQSLHLNSHWPLAEIVRCAIFRCATKDHPLHAK